MRLKGISGSIRTESYNTMLLKNIQDRYRHLVELEIIEIEHLPLFNQDEELEPPKVVKEFKKEISECDGVIIATPEYNWSVPGVLKNSLDWLSRGDRPMIGKSTMIVGASTGMMGTIRAQIDLRKILSSPGLNAKVLPPAPNEFLVIKAPEKFDEQGKLIDEKSLDLLDSVMDHFIEWQ
ncbi:NADPH-dependent FMN reductase [Oceanobacillus halotolerans]|uniref:NADPH-dependent FMN reductase n=1 Tax=Oceanobacillus halotolerans TaxID=2663380 RepID=UPI0013DB4BDC|nr:NADPH-dependent FMN reductase [Oceanobacillus halotolerans]